MPTLRERNLTLTNTIEDLQAQLGRKAAEERYLLPCTGTVNERDLIAGLEQATLVGAGEAGGREQRGEQQDPRADESQRSARVSSAAASPVTDAQRLLRERYAFQTLFTTLFS